MSQLICPKCKGEITWVTTEEVNSISYNLFSCSDCHIEVVEYIKEN